MADIPVVEIKIGGKKRPVHFGMAAFKKAEQGIGRSLVITGDKPINEQVGVDGVSELVYAALWSGARKRGRELDADEWDVADWMDDLDENEAKKMWSAADDAQAPDAEDEDESGNPKGPGANGKAANLTVPAPQIGTRS